MKKFFLTLAFVLAVPLMASAGFDNTQGQQQGQGQLQGQAQANLQGQGQVGIVKDGDNVTETRVTVPKQHRITPAITVNSQTGQSGAGISGPGFSIGGAKTEPITAAQNFIDLCSYDIGCTEDDIANALNYARSQVKTCYFLGPVGHLVTFIGDKIRLDSLDLENDGFFACF